MTVVFMSMIQPESPSAFSLHPLPFILNICRMLPGLEALSQGLETPGWLACLPFLIRSQSVLPLLGFYLLSSLPLSRESLFSSPK